MSLQAAGEIASTTVSQLFKQLKRLNCVDDPETATFELADLELDPDLCALVELAYRMSRWPQQTSPRRVLRLAQRVSSTPRYLDGVCVISGFNFINRVADALGVPTEIPEWMLQSRLARPYVIRMLQSGMRRMLDFSRQDIPVNVEQQLENVHVAFQEFGFSSPPACFQVLTEVPPFLAALSDLAVTSIRKTQGDEALRWAIGKQGQDACRRIGSSQLASQFTAWLDSNEYTDCANRAVLSAIDDFASAVDVNASQMDRSPIARLRDVGLSYERILDLVFGVSVWNAIAPLERLVEARLDDQPMNDIDRE